MGTEAAAPESGSVGQHQNGGGTRGWGVPGILGGRSRRVGQIGLQVGHAQAGGSDHGGPVAWRDGAELPPLSHGLGSHSGHPSGGVSTTHAFYDMIDGDRHGGYVWEDTSHRNRLPSGCEVFSDELW